MKKVIATVSAAVLLLIGFGVQNSATAAGWSGPCQVDSSLKKWKELNDWSMATGMCAGPLTVKKVFKVPGKPKSTLSPETDFKSAEACKISDSQGSGIRAFPTYQLDAPHPSASTRYLFLPFTSTDLPQNKTPWAGYSMYFNFLKDWLSYSNESGIRQAFTFQKEAVNLPFSVGPYKVNHDNDKGGDSSNKVFGRKFVEEVDSKIDFSKYDVVLVIPPAGSPRGTFELGYLGNHTVDGNRVVFMSVPPATYTTRFVPHFPMIAPLEWVHELHHAGGYSLQHHSGNEYWQNNRGSDPGYPGLGEWGLMNMSKTDLLGWEKWIIGYIKDSQVACLDPAKESKVWLRPSGIRTDSKKLAVIPISSTKVVVLESMRAVGLNYKLSKQSQGLLVWTVDTSDRRESYGVEMVTLPSRKLTQDPFVYYDAPLKQGEQVKVAGLTIKVLESGKFGDVFSVTPGT